MANFVAKKEPPRMTEIDAIESDDKRWDAALNSRDKTNTRKLKRLVDKALERIRAGETEPLDLKKL